MNAFMPLSPTQTPARHRFTVDEVIRMVEVGLIDPDARLELMDGDLIDMPSEGVVHINYKILLNQYFVRHLADDLWVAPDATLYLAPTDAPEPDLYVIEAGAQLKPASSTQVLLVIEIADSSLGYDLGHKAAKYAAYNLSEYWVVDVAARVTHVLRGPDAGTYQHVTAVPFEAPLSATRLPRLGLVVADLIGLAQG